MKLAKGLIMTALLAALSGGNYAAEKADDSLHPERKRALAEIQGEIKNIDKPARRLTVEDKARQKVMVTVAHDLRVLDAKNHIVDWTSLKPGTSVILYYDTREMMAFQIDIVSAPVDTLLGK